MNRLALSLAICALGTSPASAHDDPSKPGVREGVKNIAKSLWSGLREIRHDVKRAVRGAEPYEGDYYYHGNDLEKEYSDTRPRRDRRVASDGTSTQHNGQPLWRHYEQELERRRAYEREHGIVHSPAPPANGRTNAPVRPAPRPDPRFHAPNPTYQPRSGIGPVRRESRPPASGTVTRPDPRPEIVRPQPDPRAHPPKVEPKPEVRRRPQEPPKTKPQAKPGPGSDSKREPGKPGYPTATKTDNPGIVTSPYPPYDPLDVTGLKSGSLAKDPLTGQIFRVP